MEFKWNYHVRVKDNIPAQHRMLLNKTSNTSLDCIFPSHLPSLLCHPKYSRSMCMPGPIYSSGSEGLSLPGS